MTPASSGQPDVEVEIPSRPEYVGVVRHVMGAVARLGQHSPEFVENAKLAGSEACANAVMLSGRAGSHDPIEVRALLGEDELRIEVADRGAPAREEPSLSAAGEHEAPAAPVTPVQGFEGGLSLPLLEGLVDELAIDEREGGGNVVRMRLIRDVEEDAG